MNVNLNTDPYSHPRTQGHDSGATLAQSLWFRSGLVAYPISTSWHKRYHSYDFIISKRNADVNFNVNLNLNLNFDQKVPPQGMT